MKILILAPSDRSYVSNFLPNYSLDDLPIGYQGASFIGALIEEFLKRDLHVTAVTTSLALESDYKIKKFTHQNFEWIVVPCRPKIFGFNQNKIGRIINLFHFEINAIFNEIKAINYDFCTHWSCEFAAAALKLDKKALITVHDNPYEIIKFTQLLRKKYIVLEGY